MSADALSGVIQELANARGRDNYNEGDEDTIEETEKG